MDHIKTLNGYKIKFVDKNNLDFEDRCPVLIEEQGVSNIDTDNYVIGQKNIWFAKPIGEVDMFDIAYASCDGGQTWYRCSRETKSFCHTAGTRTQAGKVFFRTPKSFPLGRVAMSRNVLTWYANNGEHNSLDAYEIDHVDGDFTNDRLSNLEKVDHSENIRRMRAHLIKNRR